MRPSHEDALRAARAANGGIATWTVDLPSRDAPVSLNARSGRSRWAEQRHMSVWRSDAYLTLRAACIPPLRHVWMELTIVPPDRRRRDSDNYAHLVKGPKDALVDCGIVPDDIDRWVTWTVRVAEETTGRRGVWAYRLVVSERPIQRFAAAGDAIDAAQPAAPTERGAT